jgi:hypothetical protein
MTRTTMTLALVLLAGGPARANPPVDDINSETCLELKIDGRTKSCNGDFRLVDGGTGEVSLTTGYGDPKADPKTVVAFFTEQKPSMENAYGYALRVTSVTLMTYDRPDDQRLWPAGGLCFMVKPNPLRAWTAAIRHDIVVMCSAALTDKSAPIRKID